MCRPGTDSPKQGSIPKNGKSESRTTDCHLSGSTVASRVQPDTSSRHCRRSQS